MTTKKTDYNSEALGRLLTTLQGGTKLEALVSSFVDRCQEFEDGAFPIIEQLDLATATGVGLDRLGTIVNLPRGGRSDDDYRLALRAEIAILNSDGTAYDLITVVSLLVGAESAAGVYPVQLDEYFPHTVYIRVRDHIVDEDTDYIAAQLQRAASAGVDVHFIFTTSEADDDDLFRFSDTTGTPETSSSHGFGNGTLAGVA